MMWFHLHVKIIDNKHPEFSID